MPTGLSLAAGLFVFVCLLTDSFALPASSSSYSTFDRLGWEASDARQTHDYKYGWCFLAASVLCIAVEAVAVLCITVHYKRCQTIALMIKDFVPTMGDNSSNSTYFSTKDTGCLVAKSSDGDDSVDAKTQPEDSSGLLAETPPDICSTYLNADQMDDTVEVSVRLAKNDPSTSVGSHRGKKANYATLNTRNYRCLNYSSSGTCRKYSTLGGGCSGSSVIASKPNLSSTTATTCNPLHCRPNVCAQSTIPRMKNVSVNARNRYCGERAAKIPEVQQLSCDDFNL